MLKIPPNPPHYFRMAHNITFAIEPGSKQHGRPPHLRRLSMNLSVLMFCPQFRPVVGGAERQAEKLGAALAGTGCRVTILTPRLDPGSPDSERINQVTIVRFPLTDLSRRYPVPGISVLNVPYIFWQIARAVGPRLK